MPPPNPYRTQSKRTYKQFKNEPDNARIGADTEPKSQSAMDNDNKMVGQIANIAIERIKQ